MRLDPLISVVMTAFNTESFVEKAIRSVLGQSYRHLELIIVDDASTDSTLQVISGFNDPRIRIFRNRINSGTYYSKNFAIQQVKGEYIVIQDADDYSHPDRLKLLLECFGNNPQVLLVRSYYVRVNMHGDRLIEPRAGFATSMIKREVFEKVGYYDSVKVVGDEEFDRRIVTVFGYKARKNVHEVLYFALERDGSLTDKIKIGSDDRLGYVEAFTAWHATYEKKKTPLYIPFPLVERPFDIPRAIQGVMTPERLPSVNISRVKTIAETVTASLATVRERIPELGQVVNSILSQVDRLHIFLNGFESAPAFLEHPKITIHRSQEYMDMADNGKFFGIDDIHGYHFTIDDDILYPENYVSCMISKLQQYHHQAVIGVHGIRIKEPFTSYYDLKSREVLHFRFQLDADTPIHIIGTGTLAYHTSLIRYDYREFYHPQMADIFVAIQTARRKIPRICVERKALWLKPIGLERQSIYDIYSRNDVLQTNLVNANRELLTAGIIKPDQSVSAI